ncbi:MAG: response regulator transcription factor [Pseudomonadota bacterium]
MPADRLILCDDEPELRASLAEFLVERGYEVETCANGQELLHRLDKHSPDLVVLDIRMPKLNGIEALKKIRLAGRLPVILLTALDDVVDRILGLEFGADDYVAKPVDPRELEARIRTVLRRCRGGEEDSAAVHGSVSFGGLTLNLDSAQLTRADGSVIEITAMEFALLRVLVEHPNRVLSRDRLLDLAHGRSHHGFDRSVDLRISRLRRKIEPDPRHPSIIRTIRGVGYLFDPKPDAQAQEG